MEADPDRYLDVVYNATDRPFTEYPDLLTEHLVKRFGLSVGAQLLDVGCGRGEFLRGFIRAGCVGSGVDQSTIAREHCPDDTDIRAADLELEDLPFADSSFDVVFSKSVIEHFYFPERLVKEMLRVLRPGGSQSRCARIGRRITKSFSRTTHIEHRLQGHRFEIFNSYTASSMWMSSCSFNSH